MSLDTYETIRCLILVKAYPQPSAKYKETVCVAAISEDGKRFLRLYPIRYRALMDHQRFTRFDLVEMRVARDFRDLRPESYKVDEQSIKILALGKNTTSISRFAFWSKLVGASLTQIKEQEKLTKESLGIIKPDEGSVSFFYERAKPSSDDLDIMQEIMSQNSLFEPNDIKVLEPIEYLFYLKFKSAGVSHTMQIHDWEVQQTFRQYKNRYGGVHGALDKMTQFYNDDVLTMNPHFIVGNLFSRPYQFILIGVLRNNVPKILSQQVGLF